MLSSSRPRTLRPTPSIEDSDSDCAMRRAVSSAATGRGVEPLRGRCGHIGAARSAVTSAAANARYETRAPLRIFQSKHAMAMNAEWK